MRKTELAVVKQKSLAKGLIAGAIGGLVGALAKTLTERMFPSRAPKKTEATGDAASEGIRWGFGAAVGGVYGALAEYYPPATAREGAAFGMALETLTHETALPALGLSTKAEDETVRERASGVTSHVVYGVTTEFVRKLVRKVI
jgi:putative membrane protein